MSQAVSRPPVPHNERVMPYGKGSPEKAELRRALAGQKSTVTEIPLIINGEEVRTGKTVDVVCPHDHSRVLARCHQAGAAETAAAVEGALAARREWAALPWEERAAVFLRAAELLSGPWRPVINAATMLGQSKTVHQAEIDATCELADFFRFNVHFMRQILAEQPRSAPGMWNRSEARGLEGFVYAITPFNFTSIAVNLAAAPALMGCTVLWKPSPTGMPGAKAGMDLLQEAGLPPGVIQFIPGDPREVSDVLLPHRELSGIHFTGSTATFNHLWGEVGKNIGGYRTYPRIVGETGGKDFIFAHSSADPETLATALIRGAFEYQGQKCSAASRAYIPKSLWPEVRDRLVRTAEDLTMGDPEDFRNFMGAVIDRRSFEKISGYIRSAEKDSVARILAGGACDDSKGWFIRPTVIEVEDPCYRSMTEEIFGPVLTVFPYDDHELEKTLDLCNDSTPYALTGGIFARDRLAIAHMSARLNHAAGNFYINDKPTGAVVGQQPFGGSRASGTNDKAGSMFNLLRWVSHRTIKETFTPITDYRYPYMEEA